MRRNEGDLRDRRADARTGIAALVAALVVAGTLWAPAAGGTTSLAVAGAGAGAVAGSGIAEARAGATQVGDCTTIAAPGEYVLVADLVGSDSSACLVVAADDVTVDGNGHSVDAGSLRYDALVPAIDAGGDASPSNVTVRDVRAVDGGRIRFANVTDGAVEGTANFSVAVEGGADVRVRGNEIGPSAGGIGIAVADSENATVAGNDIVGGSAAIRVERTDASTVANNTVRRSGAAEFVPAVTVEGRSNVIRGNDARRNVDGTAFFVNGSSALVAENRAGGYYEGFILTGTGHEFRDNVAVDNRVGLAVWGGTHEIVGNRLASNALQGIAARDVGGTIRNNDVVGENGSGVGIELYDALDLAIEGNDVETNRVGLAVRGSPAGLVVRGNDIAGNAVYGALSETTAPVDARWNYWGDASGPSSPADADAPLADPRTGALADGSGDAVSEDPDDPGVSNVCFDPYAGNETAGGAA